MPYTHTKFSDAVTSLSLRLSDPDFVYWSNDEMGRRIIQAMRVFQALTSYHTERASFQITPSQAIVDLHFVLAARFGFTVTDQDTIRNLQYALLEPPTGNSWVGSLQFSYAEVVNALQRRRNQFLGDTGMVLTRSRIDIPSQPIGRIPLDDSVITINRVAWIDSNFVFTPLFRDNEFSAQSYDPGWTLEPGVPQVFSAAVAPPVSLQLIPQPLDKGQLELITANTGPDLNPSVDSGVPLSVPDDFSWAVEFGTLADLLSVDGLTHDAGRAAYCEGIYRMGVEAAKINPAVLGVQINDEPVYTGSLFELDTFKPDWQSVGDKPDFSAVAGRNILAFCRTPFGTYGVSLDFVPNVPVPIDSEDYLQIGREYLEGILDLAQHFCAFKQGGGEFSETQPLLKSFLAQAHSRNDKLAASVFHVDAIYAASRLQEKEVAVMAPPAGSGTGGV